MKGLSAGLTFFNITTVCALVLGILARGLGPFTAFVSLLLGLAAGTAAWLGTADPGQTNESPAATEPDPVPAAPPPTRYGRTILWLVVAVFAIFAVRSFCWLLYQDGDQLMIQSPNNLGDLALHITYIRDFARGVPLWPENPIFPIGHLRYPAGVDLFNAVLSLAQVDLIAGLVWVGLLASLATCYALFRWGGTFTIAGFLFNGGFAGFQVLDTLWHDGTLNLIDYQGDKTIAWKSLALSMFVTQRGLLYAIPAGLLLLWQWRERYFRNRQRPAPLPFWVEFSLYASMPLFHVHTFLALSLVLVFLFVCSDPSMRGQLVTLVASALVPATFFVWLVTDYFHARSIMAWHPGWVMSDHEFGRPSFLLFWWDNFGIFAPLTVGLFGYAGWRAWKEDVSQDKPVPEEIAFLAPAAVILMIALLVKLAPWEWDNLKVMVWAYFLILPYLWRDLIRPLLLPARVALCLALFGSGFVSLFGGLAVGRPGFGFATRSEVDAIGVVTRSLPVRARYAAYPTFNHPLLLQGHNLVLGYAGHLWTQGFSDYGVVNDRLNRLMLGQGDWLNEARGLGARYIFWGREEKEHYPTSTRPWEKMISPFAAGDWGAIYDVEQSPPGG